MMATEAYDYWAERDAAGKVALRSAPYGLDHQHFSGGILEGLSPWQAATLGRQLLAAAADAGDWEPCRACGAPMAWARTETAKLIPLDIGDHLGGNLAMRWSGPQRLVRGCPPGEPLEDGEVRVMSHFASCTRPGDFRRRGGSTRHP